MKIPGTTSYVTVHRTILNGPSAEIMRWRDQDGTVHGFGGVLLRCFHRRFMIYRTRC